MHKKSPRRHSPQQNKKAVLTTAAYFKVSTPVRSCFSFTFVYQKTCFRSKTEKVNSTIEFYISELGYVKFQLKLTILTVHKKRPRSHSPQQNKKAVLTTAAYFKVSTPVRSCFSFTFVYQKTCFRSKTEKVNSTIEFYISESG